MIDVHVCAAVGSGDEATSWTTVATGEEIADRWRTTTATKGARSVDGEVTTTHLNNDAADDRRRRRSVRHRWRIRFERPDHTTYSAVFNRHYPTLCVAIRI
jgi:hypothetical protein